MNEWMKNKTKKQTWMNEKQKTKTKNKHEWMNEMQKQKQTWMN